MLGVKRIDMILRFMMTEIKIEFCLDLVIISQATLKINMSTRLLI